jgi:hypothetical protein
MTVPTARGGSRRHAGVFVPATSAPSEKALLNEMPRNTRLIWLTGKDE